ncbi:MAG: GxxExxY protein [Bacteroidetes bacterium]|nr:GxxExxY protein [Bacteroidota bacterium]
MIVSKKYLNEITYNVIGAAIEVQKVLGPGLLESVYHKCLKQELTYRSISYLSERAVNLQYKGLAIDADLRCDLLVEDQIVVELKAVESILPVHEAQLLTYMKLMKKPKGILLNFNCINIFYEGQRTFVSESFRNLPEQ